MDPTSSGLKSEICNGRAMTNLTLLLHKGQVISPGAVCPAAAAAAACC